MTTPSSNVTPLRPLPLNESEAAALIHDSYLVQLHSQICQNCPCAENFVAIFEVWTHPTKTHQSRYLVKKPTTKIIPGLEVTYLEVAPIEIPVCFECITTYKTNDKRPLPALSASAWADTLARKYAPAPAADKARPEPTLESL